MRTFLCLILLVSTTVAGGPFVSVVKQAETFTSTLSTTNLRLSSPPDPVLGFFKVPQATSGYGTGFTVSEQGHLMTCNHVVYCSTQTIAGWSNGANREATILRADPDNDIAILKILVTKPIRKAVFRDTPAQVGEDVIVIGYPVGEGLSVSRGIVSRLNCELDGDTIEGMAKQADMKGLIQIDAAVNRGNSGGPVLDTEGKVLGMISMVDGDRQGVAYAISSQVLKKRYTEMLAESR